MTAIRNLLFVAVVPWMMPSISLAAESIFPDKALESAVRRYVFEKRTNSEPLNEKDVQNISTINFKGYTFDRDGKQVQRKEKIKNLAGLEKCVSLRLLDLEGHEIADITPIKDLKLLQSVNLAKNKISDISPVAGLTKLQYLHLADNEIADVSAVEKLENMRSLYLSNNKIKDAKPLSGLQKVWSLYLDGNQVTDLKPLAGLKWLKSLDLTGNGVTDITPLSELGEWDFLFLSDNKLTDIQVLVEMAKKDRKGSNRFAPFWKVYLSGNPLSDAAKKVQIAELRKVSVAGRIHFE
jgi:internalin A